MISGNRLTLEEDLKEQMIEEEEEEIVEEEEVILVGEEAILAGEAEAEVDFEKMIGEEIVAMEDLH